MPYSKNEDEVVALAFGLRYLLQERIFCENPAERVDRTLEILEGSGMISICIGFAHRCDAVVFDLTDALARDAVFLPDGIKRASFALARQAESVRKHAPRSVRQASQQILAYVFWRE